MSILDSYDKNPAAIINPTDFCTLIEPPVPVAIATFSAKIIAEMKKRADIEVVGQSGSANGPVDILRIKDNDREIGLYLTRIGASASAATLEEVIATLGIRKLVVFGSSGILDPQIAGGRIIVPTSAYRDEGTSYHYAPPSDYIELPQAPKLAALLSQLGVDHVAGKVWTTDAFYRETLANVEKRRSEGCIAVDMECSALQAVCSFRGIELYQFLYGADRLDTTQWDRGILGNLSNDERMKYLALALAIATRI